MWKESIGLLSGVFLLAWALSKLPISFDTSKTGTAAKFANLGAELPPPESQRQPQAQTQQQQAQSYAAYGTGQQQANPYANYQVAPTPSLQNYQGAMVTAQASNGALRTTLWWKLREKWKKAKKPHIDTFVTDIAMVGKCVSKFEPTILYSGMMNIYVKSDKLLGKLVYVLPDVHDEGRGKSVDYGNMSDDEIVAIHQAMKSDIPSYSTLSDYATKKDNTLVDSIRTLLEEALMFTYMKNVTTARSRTKEVEETFYRLRADTNEEDETIVFLQRMCPYSACNFSNPNSVADYRNLTDPRSVCYFSRRVRPS